MAREISNPACLPLVYPENDPFFSQYNVTCGNFVRGATLIPSDCHMKTAEYVKSKNIFFLNPKDPNEIPQNIKQFREMDQQRTQIYLEFMASIKVH